MRPSNRFRSYIKFYRNLRVVGISASATLAAFMTLAAYPIVGIAQTAEALTGNPASTFLTITSTSPSANVDLVPRSSNGTFSSSSDTESAKFSILTDNYTGYKLLIAGSDNTGLLTNTDTTITTNNTLSSITTAIDAGVFGGDSATAFNGKWGYQPSKYYNPTSHTVVDNTNFLPSPTLDAPDTLDETTIANTKKPTATSDTLDCTNYDCNEYTIALGARADYSTVPGTYTNTFVLTAIANKIPFTINFNDNTGDSTVANLPTTISDPTGITETSVALPTTIPTRTGYSFAGWCDTVTTINSNGSTTCTNPTTGQTGIVYPASTATTTSYLDFIDQTASSNIANLYAMWDIESYTITIINSNTTSDASSLTIPFNGNATVTVTPSSGYYLSDVSCPSGYTCTGYNTGSSYTGEQTITITNNGTAAGGTLGFTGTLSALPMQDFSYASCTTTPQTVYDTRDNQQYIIQRLADGNCWMMTNLNLGAVTLSTDLTSSNTNLSTTITAANFNSYKKTSGTGTYTAAEYIPVSGNDTSSGGPGTPYGTLYNYCAASAGTICTSSNSSNASYDICPKGWRLPTGGSSGEFRALYNQSAYNSNANMRKSYTQGGAAFALAGSFGNSTPTNQGSHGYYWSSTRSYNTYMYRLYLNTSDVDPADLNNRYNGYSIRCVLLTPYEKLQAGMLSMQDIGNLSSDEKSTLLSQMTTGTSYNVSDSRDGQSYAIQKLADGNIWMLDNLSLGSTTLTQSLSTSNTNMSSSTAFTLPEASQAGSSFSSYTAPKIYTAEANVVTSSYGDTTPRGLGSGKSGVFYNYCAASAGTICTDTNSSNAQYDICPKGWRMPTGGSGGEYEALYLAYNSNNTDFRASLSTPLAGLLYNGSFAFENESGNFWASTGSSGDAYGMNHLTTRRNTDADPVSAVISSRRERGMNIRCMFNFPPAMQDFTASDAAAMAAGETKILRDSRDEQNYTVAKLPDGNVWMTQNLRFTGTSIDSSTTNIDTTKTLSYGDLTSGNSYTEPRIHNSGNATTGVWYNYCAASAGTICTDSDTTEASYSLCPAGWRLPTNSEQSGITSYSSAYSPVAGGLYTSGLLYFTSTGHWWSSTVSGTSTRYYLNWNGSSLSTNNDGYRSNGRYVRCVLDIPTMQDFTASDAAATAAGETKTLYDSRDGQDYTVAKLPDGKVWMTKNLAIGCNGNNRVDASLNSTNSNVSSYTINTTNVGNLTADTSGSYTEAYMQCDATYGAWYNYMAATAGTISGSSNSTNATSDICPSGWRLPTRAEQEAITGYTTAFSPVTGGRYYKGSLELTGGGGWRSSTAYDGGNRYGLYYNGSSLYTGRNGREVGLYVRCVRSS